MTVAVSKAVEEGARAVIVASTGNTASSAAAYAARAGISAIVLLPEGTVASGKVAQSRMYGARCSKCVARSTRRSTRRASSRREARTHSSIRSIPTGAKARRRPSSRSSKSSAPRPARSTPVRRRWQHHGLRGGPLPSSGGQPSRLIACEARDRADTVATAIRITEPVHAQTAAAAIKHTEGRLVTLGDDEILAAWETLRRWKGSSASRHPRQGWPRSRTSRRRRVRPSSW